MGSMPSARTHSTTAGLKMESRSKMRYLGAVSYGNASRSEKIGTPGRIRTYDLQIRSLALYPAELRAHLVLSITYAALLVKSAAQQCVLPTRQLKISRFSLTIVDNPSTSLQFPRPLEVRSI